MARPTVSVIIPTFNRLQWLGQALDSVAAQQFADYETVVVDDGSDDGTDQMIAARPEPIRYFWQPNQGAARARNRGIAEARGRFVAFLDSDDLWLPRYLQACVSLLRQKPDLAMVYCDFACVDADGRPLKGHHKRQYAGDVIEQLFASIFIQTSCVTARRDVIVQAGGFGEHRFTEASTPGCQPAKIMSCGSAWHCDTASDWCPSRSACGGAIRTHCRATGWQPTWWPRPRCWSASTATRADATESVRT
ncbi:MAG: glycosyltransferase family 2 protein [Phycisphaerae bacterium]